MSTAQPAAIPRWPWLVPPAVTLTVTVWGIRGASYWQDEAATMAASSGVSAIGRRLVSMWAGLAGGLLFARCCRK